MRETGLSAASPRDVPLKCLYMAGSSPRTIAMLPSAPRDSRKTSSGRKLGFQPRPLEVGLRETLEYEMKRWGMKRPGSDKEGNADSADQADSR